MYLEKNCRTLDENFTPSNIHSYSISFLPSNFFSFKCGVERILFILRPKSNYTKASTEKYYPTSASDIELSSAPNDCKYIKVDFHFSRSVIFQETKPSDNKSHIRHLR